MNDGRPSELLALAGAGLLTLLLLTASLALGSVRVAPADIVRILSGAGAPGAGQGLTTGAEAIIRLVRLPRTLTALGAGAALGLAGLVMQTVFRNALAGPGVLGVTSGAGLGVALVLLAGPAAGLPGVTALAALAGAAGVLLLALLVNHLVGEPVFLLVLGLLFGYAASSITTLLMASTAAEGLQRYIVWSFGSFALPPGSAPVLLPAMAALATAGLAGAGPRVDALLMGPLYAESSGLHARRMQGLLIAGAGVLTGLVTAYTGPIVFVGVSVPHIARGILRSSRHRRLAVMTALCGAVLGLGADLVARLPGSERALPLNAVTSLLGVPVVVAVVVRARAAGGRGGMGL